MLTLMQTAACVGSGFPKQPNLYEPTSEVYPLDFVSNWVEPLIKFRNNSSDNSFGSTGPPSFLTSDVAIEISWPICHQMVYGEERTGSQ